MYTRPSEQDYIIHLVRNEVSKLMHNAEFIEFLSEKIAYGNIKQIEEFKEQCVEQIRNYAMIEEKRKRKEKEFIDVTLYY